MEIGLCTGDRPFVLRGTGDWLFASGDADLGLGLPFGDFLATGESLETGLCFARDWPIFFWGDTNLALAFGLLSVRGLGVFEDFLATGDDLEIGLFFDGDWPTFFWGDANLGLVFGLFPFGEGSSTSIIDLFTPAASENLFTADFEGDFTGTDKRRGVAPLLTGVIGGSALSKSSGLIEGPKETLFLLALLSKVNSAFLFLLVLDFCELFPENHKHMNNKKL